MQYVSHSDWPIMIAHFPGQSKTVSKDILNEGKKNTVRKPYNVEIISIITKSYLGNDDTTLDYQLKLNGIDYINPAKNYIWKWTNAKKVGFIIKALKKVKTDYALILDGADVCIMSDMTDLIDRFNTYKKDIIFNATIWPFPKVEIDNVDYREQYGRFCHLNAGCCIGKTSALLKFYKEVQTLIKADKTGNPSEQYYVRQAFSKHQDTVFFDYDCRIFQIWHKPNYEITCKLM